VSRPLVLAPWSSRFHGPGMEEGPGAVAEALGSPRGGERVGFDLDAPPEQALADGLPALSAAVAGAAGPLALLGECTLAPAVVAGLRSAHPDLALVWIDAHGDLNTPETTPSGFLGGMPFAVLLGWCHEPLRTAAGLEPPLPEERAALVGARDLDPGERAAIERSRLVVADDVAGTLERLPDDAPLYVHLDGDVLDPEDAPGVDFPAPGGWRLPRLVDEMTALAATGRVVGVSLCCGNPRRDPDGRSAAAYAEALAPMLDP
jgi:arginase